MKLFIKMFALSLCLALVFPAIAVHGGEDPDEVEQAPQATEAEPKTTTEVDTETKPEVIPAPAAPVEQPVEPEASTASTKNETASIADSGRTAEVRIGSDAQAPTKPAPTIAPSKPARTPVASARLTVEGERPVDVEFLLFADPIKAKANAFRKEEEQSSLARYTMEARFLGRVETFVLNERGPAFPRPAMSAECYSQDNRHLWRVAFEMAAPSAEFGKSEYREDHFLVWNRNDGRLSYGFCAPAWAEPRHELSANSSFAVERDLDGNLDWNGGAFVTLNDKVTYAAGAKNVVEYRSERWNWNAAAGTFEPAAQSLEYEVQKGDMLVSIGRFYFDSSTAWQKILDANPDINPKNMKIGARLKIPME